LLHLAGLFSRLAASARLLGHNSLTKSIRHALARRLHT
jgi:hypothetical protein